MKTCSSCGQTRPLTEFHRDSRSADGRRGQCKPCRLASVKDWYEATRPERKRVRDTAHAVNPERRRALDRERYQRDRDKRLPAASQQARARRAALVSRPRDIGITREALRERDGDACFYCAKTLSFTTVGHGGHPHDQATVEHLTRIADGGADTWGNVVLACWECNIARGKRPWAAWREARGNLLTYLQQAA